MALIELLWSPWPDACYKPTTWSVSNCTNRLHPVWHAKWIMSVRNIANTLYVSLSFLWYYLCWFFPVEASTGDSLDDLVDVAGQDQDNEDTSNNIVREPDELVEVKLCSQFVSLLSSIAFFWHLTFFSRMKLDTEKSSRIPSASIIPKAPLQVFISATSLWQCSMGCIS